MYKLRYNKNSIINIEVIWVLKILRLFFIINVL
jgi:hypothetical protein